MNILKTHTLANQERNTLLLYWTNSTNRPNGSIKVWAGLLAQAISTNTMPADQNRAPSTRRESHER